MVALVIPALNEGEIIGEVVCSIPALVDRVIVVDNGSTDDTATRAEEAGALVVAQPASGYGRACRAGVHAAIAAGADIIVFMDGDGSDCPEFLEALVTPILRNKYDFVIGSRIRGEREPGSLTFQQVFAGRLAGWMLQAWCGIKLTDMSPLRLELGNADAGSASQGADPGDPGESSAAPGRSFQGIRHGPRHAFSRRPHRFHLPSGCFHSEVGQVNP